MAVRTVYETLRSLFRKQGYYHPHIWVIGWTAFVRKPEILKRTASWRSLNSGGCMSERSKKTNFFEQLKKTTQIVLFSDGYSLNSSVPRMVMGHGELKVKLAKPLFLLQAGEKHYTVSIKHRTHRPSNLSTRSDKTVFSYIAMWVKKGWSSGDCTLLQSQNAYIHQQISGKTRVSVWHKAYTWGNSHRCTSPHCTQDACQCD